MSPQGSVYLKFSWSTQDISFLFIGALKDLSAGALKYLYILFFKVRRGPQVFVSLKMLGSTQDNSFLFAGPSRICLQGL